MALPAQLVKEDQQVNEESPVHQEPLDWLVKLALLDLLDLLVL